MALCVFDCESLTDKWCCVSWQLGWWDWAELSYVFSLQRTAVLGPQLTPEPSPTCMCCMCSNVGDMTMHGIKMSGQLPSSTRLSKESKYIGTQGKIMSCWSRWLLLSYVNGNLKMYQQAKWTDPLLQSPWEPELLFPLCSDFQLRMCSPLQLCWQRFFHSACRKSFCG